MTWLMLCKSVIAEAMPNMVDFFRTFSKKKEKSMQDRIDRKQREKDRQQMTDELKRSFSETQIKLRSVK